MLIDNNTPATTDASATPDTDASAVPTSASQVPATTMEPTFAALPDDGDLPDPDEEPSLIPKVNDRPRFVVFDDWYEAHQRKYAPGVWYFDVKTEGKGENARVVEVEYRICGPLHIKAGTTDAHDASYGRLLRFQSERGSWKEWAMPMTMLAGKDCSDLIGRLMDQGLFIDVRRKAELPRYLQSRSPQKSNYLQCVLQTGWSDASRRAFVLPDEVIGPKADRVVYQSEDADNRVYRTGGTLQGWQAGIAAVAVGNPLLVLALCTAFAGPVLAMCHAEGGGPHFVGGSSTGKTSMLEAACSVWGKPDDYKRSWRATSNGLEAAAALFNDSMLALDEISECEPTQVGAVVYMMGNGHGKARASRAGGARHVARWRCSLISTGERSIGTSMAEGGHRIKAGQQVRVFDVPCDRTHGAWDELHHHASGVTFSNALKREAATHYGHAGREFLRHLTRADADLGDLLHQIRQSPEFHTDGEGQQQRVAGRFAVLALAGELATSYGVTGWPQGEAIRAAGVAFAAWRALQSNADGANAERGQAVEAVTAFIERHGDSRFSNADFPLEDSRAALFRERAGYYRDTDGQRVYLFNNTGLREALKGFDFGRGMDALEQAGLMKPPGKDGKRSVNRRINGSNAKYYEVWPEGVPQPGARHGTD